MIGIISCRNLNYYSNLISYSFATARRKRKGLICLCANTNFSILSTRNLSVPILQTKSHILQALHRSFRVGKQVKMAPHETKKFSPFIFNNKSCTQLAAEGINTEHGVIGTHNGTFHCDEVTACVMLTLLPQYADAVIVRTRDEKLLNDFNVVVDVGAVYDPDRKRFDHHQRSFNECMNSLDSTYPWVTKLSSAGLIYFHFGHELLSSVLKLPVDSKEVKCLFRKVYEHFIEEIDGIDNGIDAFHKTPRYSINTHLSARIKHLNPAWNSDANEDLRFADACRVVREELLDRIFFYHDVWWPAREIVLEAVTDRFQVDSSGEIMEFKRLSCPWKDHLLTLEEELNIVGKIKFVLFSDNSGMWRVQTVPVEINSFDNRISLKKEWWGLRNEQLQQVSGIEGCTFVHANGFIGGNKDKKGALQMAIESLKAAQSETHVT